METPPSLPQGEERLTEASWGGSFQSGKEPTCRDRRPRLSARNPLRHSRSCSLVRTDEGVCPYWWRVVDVKGGTSLIRRRRFLNLKKASL